MFSVFGLRRQAHGQGRSFSRFAFHGQLPTGQAGALRHGLARALVVANEEYRTPLRKNGYLTRDSRMVERKKYGQPGARKKFQYSKR